jgi:hypothetical protein
MTGDAGMDKEKATAAEKMADEWRKRGDLPFPDFHPDEISGLHGQIVYPPPESSVHKKKERGNQGS